MEVSGGLSVGKVCVVPLGHTALTDIFSSYLYISLVYGLKSGIPAHCKSYLDALKVNVGSQQTAELTYSEIWSSASGLSGVKRIYIEQH